MSASWSSGVELRDHAAPREPACLLDLRAIEDGPFASVDAVRGSLIMLAMAAPTRSPRTSRFEARASSDLLEVLIRAALIGILAVLCYVVFAPFLTLMVWAVILAVAMYPLHQRLARRIGGRRGLAATIVIVAGSVLIVVPSALLMNSLGGSVYDFVNAVRQNTLEVPPPPDRVAEWPIVGARLHDVWGKAHADLPGLVASMQPKIGELARKSIAMVAGIGLGVLHFIASFIVAGILMAYGEAGARSGRAVFSRIMGPERGERFARLCTATIRTVAQGVIGIAFVQALLVGLALLVAGIPWAGVLAAITLVISIAQIPALLVTLPAIVYIWYSGHYGTAAAITFSVVLLLAGMIDNVLKPLMLGRGTDAPMPVILLGALGGLAAGGILGMFVGATVLALGYQIFMMWVAADPDASAAIASDDAPAAAGPDAQASRPTGT
jgi:predicted PurR-regulated permease PerM